MCTHNHTAAGLQTPEGVFRVNLVSKFSLHQRFLLRPVSYTHLDAAGLHADTDLRTVGTETAVIPSCSHEESGKKKTSEYSPGGL